MTAHATRTPLDTLTIRAALYVSAAQTRGVFGQMAVVAAAVLVPTYFVQFSVVPSSLAAGGTEGITLLTQYNPHGVFIALEEAGYLFMSLSFLFAIPSSPIQESRLASFAGCSVPDSSCR